MKPNHVSIQKVSRAGFLKAYPDFPRSNYYQTKYTSPDVYDSYILHVDAKSTRGLCTNVARELTRLIKYLDYKKVAFLGDLNIPWLYRDHPYKPVKDALIYLATNNISKNFAGAIKLDANNTGLFELTKRIFWLVRCNGVVFIPHFSDPGFNIVGSICQYGNIHLSTLNQEIDILFNEALKKTSFVITDKSKCKGRIYKRRAAVMQA